MVSNTFRLKTFKKQPGSFVVSLSIKYLAAVAQEEHDFFTILSFLFLLTPVIRSKLFLNSRSFGISSGGFCKSASRVIIHLPRDSLKPAKKASDCPLLVLNETNFIDGKSRLIFSSIFNEESVLPSFTYIISYVKESLSSTLRRELCNGRIELSSLKSGMMAEYSIWLFTP